MTVTDDDHQLAARLARTAGQLLIDLRRSGVVEGKALGALGDAVANSFLMGALRELRPHDARVTARALAAMVVMLRLTHTPADAFLPAFVDILLRGIAAR